MLIYSLQWTVIACMQKTIENAYAFYGETEKLKYLDEFKQEMLTLPTYYDLLYLEDKRANFELIVLKIMRILNHGRPAGQTTPWTKHQILRRGVTTLNCMT